jgi:uncharacterized protein YkwD
MGGRRAQVGRLLLATAFAAVIGSGAIPAIHRTDVAQAATATTIEDEILGWLNRDRVAHGLTPLRLDTRVRDLAEYRAGVMASTGIMSHTIAGCLSCQLTARGIQWYSESESIAWTGWAWGDAAAQSIYSLWHDATHWPMLMSPKFNYIGIGIAYRSANRTTWSSLVVTESSDHTAPWARMTSVWHSGTTVGWKWTGGDTQLQTHTAGLKNFDVEYRVGWGPWVLIRSGTTATALTLYGRAHGHYYGLRVRSRDWHGNVSGWTAELRIWVP